MTIAAINTRLRSIAGAETLPSTDLEDSPPAVGSYGQRARLLIAGIKSVPGQLYAQRG